MIISHARKFIFIKTLKTGGTSLEEVLWKHCGTEDVLTPMVPEGERARAAKAGMKPQNYGKPLREHPPMQRLRLALRRQVVPIYVEHSPAWQVRQAVGEEIWNSYYKFCVVRHPFDRCVSRFFYTVQWEQSRKRIETWDRSDIDQFLRYCAAFVNENWPIYTVKDEIIVDKVVKYEELEAGLGEVSARIGLGHNLYDEMKTVRSKGDLRPPGTGHETMLSERQRALISLLCEKEMALFGYEGAASAPAG